MNGWLQSISVALALALCSVAISGCGDDDGGGGNNTGPGPEVTFLGVIRADDTLLDADGLAGDGTPIFTRTAGATGLASGFALVVEGRPGSNDAPVGTSAYQSDLTSFPDLIVQASRNLGDGSVAVCDDPISMPGGVPGESSPDYEQTPENIARINDFACRFVDGAGEPEARQTSSDSCVNFNGDFRFVEPQSTVQYCGFVNVPLGFPMGDTTVWVNLRDADGHLSATEKLIIRVVP